MKQITDTRLLIRCIDCLVKKLIDRSRSSLFPRSYKLTKSWTGTQQTSFNVSST